MKKKAKAGRILCLCAIILLILFSLTAALKWDAIFQRGNPIPYMAAMVKLSGSHTFEAVPGLDNTYITRRGEQQALFQMIEDTYGVEFKDQLGSGYLFSDGRLNYLAGSEVYWGRFTVWTFSFEDGFPA